MKKIFLCVVLIWIGQSTAFGQDDGPVIDHAYFRKVHDLDTGTVHIFVKNPTSQMIHVDQVFLDDQLLTLKNCPNDEVLWFQVTPPEILPGKTANIKIKLAQKPQKRLKAEVVMGEYRLKRVLNPEPADVRLTKIAFGKDFKKIYMYIANDSGQSLKVKEVFVDDTDVTGLTQYVEGDIFQGEKRMFRIDLEDSLEEGSYISLKAIFQNERVVESVVKAFRLFPISSWDGDTREELGFDPYPFRFTVYEGKYDGIPADNPMPVVHLMDHPNCLDNTDTFVFGSHAQIVVDRGEDALSKYPSWPTMIYGCEYKKPEAYFLYGEMTDVFLVNLYEVYFNNGKAKDNGDYVRLGKLACEPRPLFISPAAFEHADGDTIGPSDLLKTVFYELGHGGSGIVYFNSQFAVGKGYSEKPDLLGVISEINWMARELKDYFLIGEPFKLAIDTKGVDVFCIVAGDEGMIVLGVKRDGVSKEVSFRCRLPQGFQLSSVHHLNRKKKKLEEVKSRAKKQQIKFRMKRGWQAEAWVVKFM